MSLAQSVSGVRKSCLTDRPVANPGDDNLEAQKYVQALSKFIRDADTPVTIGIQGGWGSGKTSLITIIQNQLEKNDAKNAAEAATAPAETRVICVPVNAWEHALFHSSDSKAEVAISILSGLVNGVKEKVSSLPWLDKQQKGNENQAGEIVEKALQGLKVCLMFAGKVAAQMLSNACGTGDVSNVDFVGRRKDTEDSSEAKPSPQQLNLPLLAEYVNKLRSGLKNMIQQITYDKKPVKCVFFIDDLDRVPPSTAVEILDITKNIFDIPNCVFVLAIDYDVIVKGLEVKFGIKGENNEREFRQYFDKIIQIPFTMPVGAYSKKLTGMLGDALAKIGYGATNDHDEILEKIATDAELATGGIPRSVKRIINTLSLLQYIANEEGAKGGETELGQGAAACGLSRDLEARFIIVALHINFPEVCRRLMEKPNFPAWNRDLNLPWKLNYNKYEEELDLITGEFFDDEWERVLYCLCAPQPWLKNRVRNISRLMNNLLKALTPEIEDPKQLSDEGRKKLEDILEGIRVVTIDSDTAAVPQKFDATTVRDDQVSTFCKQMQDLLAERLPDVIETNTGEWAKQKPGRREMTLDVDLEDSLINKFFIHWEKDSEDIRMGFNLERPSRISQTKIRAYLEKKGKKAFLHELEGKKIKLYISLEGVASKEDFVDLDPEAYVSPLENLYKFAASVSDAIPDLKE